MDFEWGGGAKFLSARFKGGKILVHAIFGNELNPLPVNLDRSPRSYYFPMFDSIFCKCVLRFCDTIVIINRVALAKQGDNAIGNVCLSLCLSICLRSHG